MIKIRDNFYCKTFEYLYLFVMVIYMGQMTRETSRMVGSLRGDLIPLLLPVFLTIILLFRHHVSFLHKKLWLFSGIMICWSMAVCYKLHDFTQSNLSYYYFLIYAIIMAFIHVRVFGRKLFDIYEHIMVVLSAISLALWGLSVLFPPSHYFFLQFPETSYGNNVLYLFNWMDPLKDQIYGAISRNAGCSWEPGRFAIMLIPAILINLSREGIAFRGNKKMIILLLALASTTSTTGYSIVILLYSIFWLEDISVKKSLSFVFFLLPIIVYTFSLDFMKDKIEDRLNYSGLTEERIEAMDYVAKKNRDAYVGSLDRFESMSLEWINFQKEPLLGYGRNTDHSWFHQEISQNYVLTGGFVKMLSQYGIYIGLYLYSILFLSSRKISRTFKHQNKYAFALAILLCSVSYSIFCVPVFTAFWLYGLFCSEEDKRECQLPYQ